MTLTIYDVLILVGTPTLITLAIQFMFARFSTKIKKDRSDEIMIKKALQAILRDRLRQNYIYYKECECIDMADKENFDNMYQIYHTLGKNGVMDDMYQQVMCLPLKNINVGKKKQCVSDDNNEK